MSEEVKLDDDPLPQVMVERLVVLLGAHGYIGAAEVASVCVAVAGALAAVDGDEAALQKLTGSLRANYRMNREALAEEREALNREMN